VSQKRIADIIDCSLKKDCQILIIFGTSIFVTQLAIKWPFNFLPHPTYASALPGEKRTSKI